MASTEIQVALAVLAHVQMLQHNVSKTTTLMNTQLPLVVTVHVLRVVSARIPAVASFAPAGLPIAIYASIESALSAPICNHPA